MTRFTLHSWATETARILRTALLPPPRHLTALLDRIERMP